MSEALYRKYRPQVFEDVVGQEPIERTLKNAVSQDKVSHAYLFCGPRGTGKTTTARLLSKALLCEKGPTSEPDGTCEDCQLVAEGAHPDVYELDAASRTGVDNVRDEIISRVHFAPTRGRYKVYIIDEVHMLSTAAFNALLKTLEEPPSHVVFVLCTTDPQKVPETIHSRCQRFDFHRISPEVMVARLGAVCMAEGVPFEGEALDLIAQRADGGLRDALTSLEQIIAFENGSVTLAGAERLLGSIDSNDMAEIMTYVGRRDIANCFQFTARYVETGADLAQFVRDMAEHVRNLYVMALVGEDAGVDVTETNRQQLTAELAWFGPDRASRLLGVLGDLMAELKTTSNPRLAFEIALTRMVRPDSDLTIEALAERVEALEAGYSAVAHVLPGPAYAAVVPGERGVGVESGEMRAEPVPPAAQSAQASVKAPQAEGDAGIDGAGESQPALREGAENPRREPMAGARDAAPSAESGARDVEGAMPTEQMEAPAAAPEGSAFAQRERGEAAFDASSGVPADRASNVEQQLEAASQQVATPGASAPRQAEQPVRSGGVGSSALANPATLQRVWQAALAEVKQRKQAHGVLFMGAKASFDAACDMVRITFPAESTFAFNAVQKPDVQDVLSEALRKAVGEPVSYCFDKAGTAPSRQPVTRAADRRAFQQAQPMQQARQAPQTQSPVAQQIEQPQGVRPMEQPVSLSEPEVQPEQVQPIRQGHAKRQVAQQAGQQEAQVPPQAFQADAASSASPGYGSAPYGQDLYDGPSYEDEPPYEDESLYDYSSYDESYEPASPMAGQEWDATQPASLNPAGAVTGRADTAGVGAPGEDPAALEALLQASFGASVTFSETDD